MKMNEQNRNLLILLSICVLTIFPLLGLTDYNTKGEPREAIVAYSMLEHGNWILPRNYDGEIAFKPPFLHWSVAAVSTLCGEVSEYSSRVPSALALIIMAAAIYWFYARRKGATVGLLTAFVMLTCMSGSTPRSKRKEESVFRPKRLAVLRTQTDRKSVV